MATCPVITIPRPLVWSLWHSKKSSHISSVSRRESHPLGFLYLTFFFPPTLPPAVCFLPYFSWHRLHFPSRLSYPGTVIPMKDRRVFAMVLFYLCLKPNIQHLCELLKQKFQQQSPWNFSVTAKVCMKDSTVYLFSIQHLPYATYLQNTLSAPVND